MNVTQALRTLTKRPGFAAAAILTLALGIGVNTSVFSVVHGVLLQDLPFDHPEQLTFLKLGARVPIYSRAEFMFLQENSTSHVDIGAKAGGRGAVLIGEGDARAIRVTQASANLFPMLGVTPELGRLFEQSEVTSGDVVMIGYGFWQSALQSDPDVIGRSITLDGEQGRTIQTIVGVLPPSANLYTFDADVWFPLDLTLDLTSKRASLQLIGRLRPEITVVQAQEEFDVLIPAMLEAGNYRESYQPSVTVIPLHDRVVGDRAETLWLLMGASAFVLLIACANVANLVLVRSTSRTREFAVRRALGAGLGRISGLVLAESLVVALAGGTLGVLVSMWGQDLMLALLPPDLPRLDEIRLDRTVLAVSLGLSVAAAALFAIVPTWQLGRVNLHDLISTGTTRSTSAGPARRFQQMIIVGQVAMALVLMFGAGLMIRSLEELRSRDTGLRSENVLAVNLSAEYPDTERLHSFFDRLIERSRSIPGVTSAALSYHVPLSGSNSITTVRLPDHPSVPPDESQEVGFQIVTPEYFRVMGIPLVRGATFGLPGTDADSQIIVSETFARRYWPGEDPIGKVVDGSGVRRVVGVVGDTRHRGLQLAPRPEAYYPLSSFHRGDMALMIRSTIPVEAIAEAVRLEVDELDANVPITQVRLMDQVVEGSLGTERRMLQLLGGLAVLALVLGAIGIYGVISYSVSQRRREMGIRLALGAGASNVIRMVVLWGFRLAALGVVAGAALSLVFGRAVESQLFGVTSTDAATLVAAAAVLTLVAVSATAIPAIRASRIQPIEVLRQD